MRPRRSGPPAPELSDHTPIHGERLVKVYRTTGGEIHAVRGIDLRVAAGTVVAVAGPSGSGKTSLVRMMAGLERPSAGSVYVTGVDLGSITPRARRELRRRTIAFVHQQPRRNLIEHLDAADHLRKALHLRSRGSSRPRPGSGVTDQPDVPGLLRSLELEHRIAHRPDQMSGGEQQRLAIACALVGQPRVVILDEPTAHLDDAAAQRVGDALAAAARRGSAVMYTSHDPRIVERAHRQLHLRFGVLAGERDPSGPSVHGDTPRLVAAIDTAGRIQLPADVSDLFPDGLVAVERRDGHVVLSAPVSTTRGTSDRDDTSAGVET